MIGIVVGTLCLVALVATVRRRHHWDYGYGPAWGAGYRDGCYAAPWEPHAHARGLGRRNLLRALFTRLDTTPGQEKAIVALLEQAREQARAQRRELREARREVAAVIGSDVLDRATLEAALAGPRRLAAGLQDGLVTLLLGLHAQLDDKQRRVLGELLADGSLLRGPYWASC
jgi:Spy/CpxP family protein refolding chaperone